MTRVLLVDDDLDLCAMQAEYLTIEGYEVVQAHDGESAVHHALSESFDIMLRITSYNVCYTKLLRGRSAGTVGSGGGLGPYMGLDVRQSRPLRQF